VMPPELSAARDEEKREQTLERQRMWYVACTRARDLLVIPHLPEASLQSWSKILNLGHDSLPELDLTTLSVATAVNEAQPANTQDADLFGEESRSMAAAAPRLDWRLPSAHDRDRTEMLEPMVRSIDAAFEFVSPIGGGRVRGIVLHKLMEEFLTGELDEKRSPPGGGTSKGPIDGIEGDGGSGVSIGSGARRDGPHCGEHAKICRRSRLETASCSRGTDLVEFGWWQIDRGSCGCGRYPG
jgi:hypothetical protein